VSLATQWQRYCETAPSTLYAARGRLISFKLEFANWLDLHRVLDFCQHSRADEDLTRLGFIAKARGDVGNGPNGGVIKAPLEADGA
jgi:hypothetical protein